MNAGVPSVNCTHCGKNLTTDDLRRIDCKHCGTVLPHHARAQQQIAVVQGMMADRNGNGIPDAYEPLVANAQANAMNHVAYGMGGVPFGANGYPMMGVPPAHMAHVQVAQANAMNQAGKSVATAMIFVVIGVVALTLIMVLEGVAFFVMAR